MTRARIVAQDIAVGLPDGAQTRGLLIRPAQASAMFVFAHGAGAGMRHVFMEDVAQELAGCGIATLRFDFPYMHAGGKRPDRPEVAHAAVRGAVAAAAQAAPDLPLFAGGKSFGGRMTSQAQAIMPLPGVRGLVFTGFPLHPRKKPAVERAAHLDGLRLPMLFIQGTRDELADLDLVGNVCAGLGARATLHLVESADHAFATPARAGRSRSQIISQIAEAASSWMKAHS